MARPRIGIIGLAWLLWIGCNPEQTAPGAPDISRPPDRTRLDLAPIQPPLDSSGPGDGQWLALLGGDSTDEAIAAAVDVAGDVIVTGYFRAVARFGPVRLTTAGTRDVFVAKLDGRTGAVKWATSAGGRLQELGTALAVGRGGEIYLTGLMDTDPAGGGSRFGHTTLHGSGLDDIFVARLGPDGAWRWARSVGGDGRELGRALAVDGAGQVWLAADTTSARVEVGGRGLEGSSETHDLLLVRLDESGKVLDARRLGGSGHDHPAGLSPAADGGLLLCGRSEGAASVGGLQLETRGGYDLFVARLDRAGRVRMLLGTGGGWPDDGAMAVAAGQGGHTLLAGYFRGTVNMGHARLTSTLLGANALVARLSPTGQVSWALALRGFFGSRAHGLAAIPGGGALFTGSVVGDASLGALKLPSTNDLFSRLFVARVNGRGMATWARAAGPTGASDGRAVVWLPGGVAVVVGRAFGAITLGERSWTTRASSSDALVWAVRPE